MARAWRILKAVDATGSPWSWRLFRSSAAGATALLLIAGALTAAPPQGGAQTPQFRAGVDLVEVDVTVLDRDGRPVTTLSAADFEVRGGDVNASAIFLVTADRRSWAEPAARLQAIRPRQRDAATHAVHAAAGVRLRV
jgi:hypothetical protein